jgi:cytochrome P450
MQVGYAAREDVPANVPAHLVRTFDIFTTGARDGDYQRDLERLRVEMPPIFWTPCNGGHWVVSGSQNVDAILNDTSRFSNRNLRVPKWANANPPLKPLQLDPPEHSKYRALLMPAMSPKAVNTLAVGARELAIQLIEGFKPRGHCEFVSEFAEHLPIAIFMAMVDLPVEDREELLKIAGGVVRPETPEHRTESLIALREYGMAKLRARRADPGADLISTLGTATIDGRLLADDELAGMLTLLLLAGLDTVASMLSYFAMFLARNPGHRRQLLEKPELIPNAVEELLRRYGISVIGREVIADIDFAGVRLNEGDMIVSSVSLGNLDPALLPDSLEVDFERKSPRHVTFGGGPHRCMGSMLARAELRIFLEEWLPRIPDFEIAPDAKLETRVGAVATIQRLPLVWRT